MPSDIVLLVTAARGGHAGDREMIQLLSFLASSATRTDVRFELGLREPFSAAIDEATRLLVLSGALVETAAAKPLSSGRSVDHSYTLSDAGRGEAEQLAETHPEDWRAIQEFISDLGGIAPEVVSAAARRYLLGLHYDETDIADAPADPRAQQLVAALVAHR